MCTNNQYPHVVSVCPVYAFVALKVRDESQQGAIPSAPFRIRMTLRMVTDADPETWRHGDIPFISLCAICSQQVGCHGSPSFSILCHSDTVII